MLLIGRLFFGAAMSVAGVLLASAAWAYNSWMLPRTTTEPTEIRSNWAALKELLLEAQLGFGLLLSLSLSLNLNLNPSSGFTRPETSTLAPKAQADLLRSLVAEALSSQSSHKPQALHIQSAQARVKIARWQF
jgi:hypothetical protein